MKKVIAWFKALFKKAKTHKETRVEKRRQRKEVKRLRKQGKLNK